MFDSDIAHQRCIGAVFITDIIEIRVRHRAHFNAPARDPFTVLVLIAVRANAKYSQFGVFADLEAISTLNGEAQVRGCVSRTAIPTGLKIVIIQGKCGIINVVKSKIVGPIRAIKLILALGNGVESRIQTHRNYSVGHGILGIDIDVGPSKIGILLWVEGFIDSDILNDVCAENTQVDVFA